MPSLVKKRRKKMLKKKHRTMLKRTRWQPRRGKSSNEGGLTGGS